LELSQTPPVHCKTLTLDEVPTILTVGGIKGRTKWYESVEKMQQDLDEYLLQYNQKRPHQGRNMNGQTPYSVFKKGLPKRPKTGNRKADEKAA